MELFRLDLHYSRTGSWILAPLGVLNIILAVAYRPSYAALLYVLGFILIIEWPLLLLVGAYRARELIRKETELTLTGEGLLWRTDSYTLRVAWEMVQRADELKDHWVIVTKKPIRRIPLRKRALSQEQQTELAAFLQARQLNGQVRKSMRTIAGG